ncbi:thiopurine S-methyltransferase [Silvibacterium dinghuense]|uniref:Thiopurine S-methyltransferase n=1 Tax=Silvibacterium dinghuense TaxID=1560006 RepID=A0A4V1NVW1_9BACT|nr:thiopurine S-methyltransferase [Silvibacterium dinghuense]RXS97302.1 thiopurine S-methyltransferase [Silvibacterium dinghuense]GGG97913.1 thiopurine S-methyltransferase [Silvibacterium dinghuense]
MQEAFWQDRWKNNQIGFHTPQANPLLVRHFGQLQMPAPARVFIPLCGKSLDMHWLLSQGHRVAGAELSPIAVAQFFEELGREPRVTAMGSLQRYDAEGVSIFQGSIFDLTPEMLGPVDMVYDRAALVAFPEEMRDRYVPHLLRLTDSAPQLLICFEYDQVCDDGPPFSVDETEVRRLYPAAAEQRLLERQEVAGGLKGKCPAMEAVWRLRPEF